ncbi:hypothetical protein [Pseudomonas sp. 10S4]|uniref:hypothetical protein n=1 Tax=Pseudomonas sp. 10S4 TaxID=3048583 RepID=UPI002B23D106|nr:MULTISPECIES: hypothetical protein [unclassified Pseudomonas]MEB0223238.1 hypothetical protein [Pseudomonas sp. 5S1]MEB0294367.1 hypothetical protein [Pseudomonas sp. 10S4]
MFRIFKFWEFYAATSPGDVRYVHKPVAIKNASDDGAVRKCQYIFLVGNWFLSLVEQLKLNEGFFFQELREKAASTA